MILGVHHPALSVTDLDRSIAFYRDRLGMVLQSRGAFGGEVMDRITDLSGTSGRSAMLRAGAQYLELFEFSAPVPRLIDPPRRVCDHGLAHFCLEVDDVQRAYEQLLTAGVIFHCPPQPFGRMRATYARDPDGNVFELLEVPDDEPMSIRPRDEE